jgi:O-antigen ligase
LGGLFSDRYTVTSTLYAAFVAFTLVGIFYIFFLGLKNDRYEDVVEYFTFVTALVAILIFADTVHLYAVHGSDFIVDGAINRGLMLYGWGNCNTAGNCAADLIPMCFLGVMRSKTPIFYFVCASLAMASAFLSTSRNGLLVGAAFYVLCFFLACFIGKRRLQFAIIAAVTVSALAIAYFIFKDTLALVLQQYVERGLESDTRIALWEYAKGAFAESPILGKGFFGLWTDTYKLEWGFPTMMHNTILQLLASSGVVGFAGYMIHRAATVFPFIRKPTLEKTMLGFSILAVLIGSLADNFVFYIPHMLYYPIALAIAFKIYYVLVAFRKCHYYKH